YRTRPASDLPPPMPGSPAILLHPMPVRIAYACVAVLVGITGGLGNALVIANLPSIQGDLGLTPSQGAWLPAAYFMVNVSANLLLIKFRQQYGLRRFARSEEHTSELQSRENLVCRLLLEKKKNN